VAATLMRQKVLARAAKAAAAPAAIEDLLA
jgi:hypothetical protein